MLTGEELGQAIEQARRLKGISKAEMARHFRVKPPSVSGWITTGRIDKQRLNELFDFFSDTVPPSHWGLTGRAADLYTQTEIIEVKHFGELYPNSRGQAALDIEELKQDPDAYYSKQRERVELVTKLELLGLIEKLDQPDLHVLREMARRMFEAQQGKKRTTR